MTLCFSQYPVHICDTVYNVIQTELPGIKVLFLLLLINAKIPIDFAEIKSGLKWPSSDICRDLPKRRGTFGTMRSPYGVASFLPPSAAARSCNADWSDDNKNGPNRARIYDRKNKVGFPGHWLGILGLPGVLHAGWCCSALELLLQPLIKENMPRAGDMKLCHRSTFLCLNPPLKALKHADTDQSCLKSYYNLGVRGRKCVTSQALIVALSLFPPTTFSFLPFASLSLIRSVLSSSS